MTRAFALACFVLILSLAADAQICPGSHLNYYVRDAHGKLFDADSNGLIFEEVGGDTKRYGSWAVATTNGYRTSGVEVPSDIALFGKLHESLVRGGMCGFRGPTDLKLTLNGQVMELHFGLPDMGGGTSSANFSVDSIPFKAGKYTIDLTKPTTASKYSAYGGYFAASAWKSAQ
ncbi:MAG: hypothetical protein JO314_08365 [Acidobacteria bacterium]|nr:hypothetical protein [Acidobacteriota bacterium]